MRTFTGIAIFVAALASCRAAPRSSEPDPIEPTAAPTVTSLNTLVVLTVRRDVGLDWALRQYGTHAEVVAAIFGATYSFASTVSANSYGSLTLAPTSRVSDWILTDDCNTSSPAIDAALQAQGIPLAGWQLQMRNIPCVIDTGLGTPNLVIFDRIGHLVPYFYVGRGLPINPFGANADPFDPMDQSAPPFYLTALERLALGYLPSSARLEVTTSRSVTLTPVELNASGIKTVSVLVPDPVHVPGTPSLPTKLALRAEYRVSDGQEQTKVEGFRTFDGTGRFLGFLAVGASVSSPLGATMTLTSASPTSATVSIVIGTSNDRAP